MIWAVSNIYLTKSKRSCRNETYTIGRRTSETFVPCTRSNVTPEIATRSVCVDMAIKWRQFEKAFCVLVFHSTKSGTTVRQDFRRKFYKNPLCANSISFLWLSRHFPAMSKVALLLAIVGVTKLIPYTKRENWSSHSISVFNFWTSFSFCSINIWNRSNHLYLLCIIKSFCSLDEKNIFISGRLISQAVNRRLFITEAELRVQVSPCGTCGGTSFSPSPSIAPVRIIPPLLHIRSNHLGCGSQDMVFLCACVRQWVGVLDLSVGLYRQFCASRSL
jgi:hypothetical protein